MKKMIRLGLCMGLLSAALTCTALAATPNYTTDKDGTVTYQDGKYSASYSGTKTDNQYVLLVVKGTPAKYSVSEDTIVYIDQKPATAAGVSFENWIPMSTPDCVVLLGGVFEEGVDSPLVLGTLKGQGVTVSGIVDYYNYTEQPWSVNIAVEGTDNSIQTATDGTFEVTLSEGMYKFKVTADGYLTHTENIEITTDTTQIMIDYKSYAGDVDQTGAINPTDLSYLLADFNDLPTKGTDLNHSGIVNGTDLSILLGNLGNIND